MRNDFYVYVWKRPCGTPFYVGKGRGHRSKSLEGRSLHFLNIVDKIRQAGFEPVIEYAAKGLSESDAFSAEVALIASLGRIADGGTLVNVTCGGEGASGFKWPDNGRAILKSINRQRGPLRGELKGVCYDNDCGSWVAKILIDGNRVALGRFETPQDAAAAYDSAAMDAWGTDCYLNMNHADTGELRRNPNYPRRRTRSDARHKSGPIRSIYKGVSYHKGNSKWAARIKRSGKNVHLGYHSSPEEAARAYDVAAYSAWGRECYLNFPDGIPANDRPSPLADSEEPPPPACAA